MAFKWTKEKALAELKLLADQTEALKNSRTQSAEHVRWFLRAGTVIDEVFGHRSCFHLSLDTLPWYYQGTMLTTFFEDIDAVKDAHNHKTYMRSLNSARGILLAAIDKLKRSGIANVYQGKDTGPESSAILQVIRIAESLLRKSVRTKPDKEREIQNTFETLLIGADIPYSREADRITYSSKDYIPDFSLPRLDLALEVKLCHNEGREKELIAEMNDDILAYRTKYGNILFVVYDLGFIRDVGRFMKPFEENKNATVRVVKH